MDDIVRFALVTLASVFFIVDPIAVVPTYLVITDGQTTQQRQARGTSETIIVHASIVVTLFLSRVTLHLASGL